MTRLKPGQILRCKSTSTEIVLIAWISKGRKWVYRSNGDHRKPPHEMTTDSEDLHRHFEVVGSR